MTQTQLIGIIVMSVIFILLAVLVYCSNNYSLNGIKNCGTRSIRNCPFFNESRS